jgi:hypothetical protein
VKEGHLILIWPSTEEDLIYLLSPLLWRFVREHRLEYEIGALALQPGRYPQTRPRIDLSHLARIQVMDSIWSHREAYPA